jgi:hypothetical protein
VNTDTTTLEEVYAEDRKKRADTTTHGEVNMDTTTSEEVYAEETKIVSRIRMDEVNMNTNHYIREEVYAEDTKKNADATNAWRGEHGHQPLHQKRYIYAEDTQKKAPIQRMAR